MPGDLLRLTVEVEPGTAPVRGWVHEPAGVTRRFETWLELIRALDRALGGEEAAEGGGRTEATD